MIHKEVAISQVFQDNMTYDDLFYMGRFDFVVYEKQGKKELPVLAIELDGKEHFEDALVQLMDQNIYDLVKMPVLTVLTADMITHVQAQGGEVSVTVVRGVFSCGMKPKRRETESMWRAVNKASESRDSTAFGRRYSLGRVRTTRIFSNPLSSAHR